jgi:type IV pilus assembly protein PilM
MVPVGLKSKIQRFFEPQLPASACDMSRRTIALVRLDSKNPALVDRFAVMPLPAGLLVPSLVRPNITSMPDFQAALKGALARAEIRPARISLAIPDASAKVALHSLDMLPGNEDERHQLLRWKLKKTVPFNIEEAHVACHEYKLSSGKYVVLTICVHRDVLAQYEEVFLKLGIHVGYISLSSFAAFELLARLEPELPQHSLLFVRVRPSAVSSLIMQEGRVVFFRHVDHEDEELGPDERLAGPREAASLFDEIHPCVTYFQDKLSERPLDRIYVACSEEPQPSLLSSLSERFRSPVVSLDPLRLFQSPNTATLRSLKNVLMPSLGLALGRF